MSKYDVHGTDPTDFSSASAFKREIYDNVGVGSWRDDAKLYAVWLVANDEPIPEHLTTLAEKIEEQTEGDTNA
jgi:hypothetical protein